MEMNSNVDSKLLKQTTMQDYIVRQSVTIKAEPQEVWDALTNPERTEHYFFNGKVYSDWKVGSDITFKGRIFLIKKYEMKGKILNIEPNKLLQYELKNESGKEASAGKSIVTDVLTYDKGMTTVTVSDNVGSGEGAEKRYKRSVKGWEKILKGLKKEAEHKN